MRRARSAPPRRIGLPAPEETWHGREPLCGRLRQPRVAAPMRRALILRSERPDRLQRRAVRISFGFGAHFDPRLALRRAVTEMAQ
ncbi:YcaO-like family protein, partial [Streptomyces sp. NPDC005349]|uniref:YcaO-like family protein n=1 Tax=Streptomyces sp. NPDC005349 TaxID=3157037 RepID=UPI0033BE9C88